MKLIIIFIKDMDQPEVSGGANGPNGKPVKNRENNKSVGEYAWDPSQCARWRKRDVLAIRV